MPTEVDSSSIFDTVLPNVYIKKVTLTPVSTIGSREGLEYDTGAGDSLETNQFGKKQSKTRLAKMANPAGLETKELLSI